MDSSVNGESFMRGETVRVSFDKFVKFDEVQFFNKFENYNTFLFVK